MNQPRLLDLFCGAGGCSVGYARAGFEVAGVDIEPHPDYPFRLVVADALTYLAAIDAAGKGVAAIHASPPCQGYTTMANRYRGNGGPTDDHSQLIAVVRGALEATGLPYVIENVTGARPHMRAPITLTGGMFGLRVERPRLFESNVPLTAPPARKAVDPLGIYGRSPDGRRLWTRKDGSSLRAASSLAEGAAAMGVDWMTAWEDVTEAIPPAYTEWIGQQLRQHVADSAERGAA